MKAFKKIIAVAVAAASLMSMTACMTVNQQEYDPNKQYLNIVYFNGGVVPDWLFALEKEYEAQHENVDILINTNEKDQLRDSTLYSMISYRTEEIFFTHTLNYRNYAASGKIVDISDIVTNPAAEGEKSIEERMDPNLRKHYEYEEDTYYAVPFYDNFYGAVYDVDLFENKSLYLAKDGGYTSGLEGAPVKSYGRDGQPGTADDGLPATFAEYKEWLNYMTYTANVTPYVWCASDDAYRIDYLSSLWAGYEGVNDYMLQNNFSGTDSEGNTITPENADEYLLDDTGKKFALEMCYEIISHSAYYDNDSMRGVMSHLDAQEKYLRSSADNEPIAMILEGGWWEKEASDVFESMSKGNEDSPYAYGNRRFAYMPVPLYDDDATKTPTYYSSSGTTAAIINSNGQNIDLAKDFLKSTLTEHAMSVFTQYTGVVRPYEYDLEEGVYESLSPFAQSFWDLYNEEGVQIAYAGTETCDFKRASSTYFASWNYGSRVDGTNYSDPYIAFMNHPSMTAQQYLEGCKTRFSDYDSQYNQWQGTLG